MQARQSAGLCVSFKIATWNVNSLRVRLPLLLAFLELHQPDVVALQETKVEDHHFPLQVLQAAGYHCLFSGQKTYNGVALLSRTPLQLIRTALPSGLDPQCRLLSAYLHPVKIINLYAPNGASPDSDKYQYKLQWFEALHHYIQSALNHYPKLIVLGDFNIAPEDRDVHDPEAWVGQVLVSEAERTAFQRLLKLGLHDTFRIIHPNTIQYTWWDYRQGAFRRNRGLRIDHVLCSTALAAEAIGCDIETHWRQIERPSDHAPVMAYF